MGLFWMSQDQGKIFHFTDSMNEISMMDLKWWFSTYLPYSLTKQFPDFKLIDNPVIGIGCQTVFDNENKLIYFCKKDYKLKPEFKGKIIAEIENKFSHVDYPGLIGRAHV